jgi:hypothetical protein
MAGQQVDRGGFAGAIRADQPNKLAVLDRKVQAADSDDAAKSFG